MAEDPKVTLEKRKNLGSADARRLRRAGHVPGNVYGHHQDAVAISLPSDVVTPIIESGHKIVDMELDGSVEKAMIKDVQWDVYSTNVLHFDLLRVDPNERVEVEVPILIRGTPAGVINGGIMETPHHSVAVECPAIRIPDNIPIRVNDLKIGEAIHISDIEWGDGVVPQLPASEVVVQVTEPKRATAAEEAEESGPAEPELVGKKEEDEGED